MHRCCHALLRGLTWLACALVGAAPASASSGLANLDPAHARFFRLDSNNGLSQNTVLAITEDAEGLLWVATLNGLNRYDGYQVEVFRPQTGRADSLSDNYVSTLTVDAGGRLWVATLEGLNRYEPLTGGFSVFRHALDDPRSLPSNTVNALLAAADGGLWIGTESGLARRLPGRDEFESWSRAKGNADEVLPDDRVFALDMATNGELWVGTAAGLARFDPVHGTFAVADGFPFLRTPIRDIHVDRSGRVWVAAQQKGLAMRDPGSGRWWTFEHDDTLADSLGSDAMQAISEDRDGTIWLGSDAGLDRVESIEAGRLRVSRFRHLRQDPYSLGGGRVSALYQDRAGRLWAGTWNGGLSALSQERNRVVSFTPDLASVAVMRNPASIALAATADALWIGSGEGGYRLDLSQLELQPFKDGERGVHYAVRRVDNELWFGTGNGLSVVDIATARSRVQPLPSELGQSSGRRLLFTEHHLWLAASPAGLALLKRDTLQLQRLHPIARQITFIERFDERTVVVGSYDGLYWFDADSGDLRHVHGVAQAGQKSPSLLPYAAMGYAAGADNSHWLASNGAGLLRIENADPSVAEAMQFSVLGNESGLVNLQLKSILADRSGHIWVSSARAISVFDPATGRFRNFDSVEGALSNDYINNSAVALEDGRLAFGGMDGFSLVNPAEVLGEPMPAAPVPRVSSLRLDGDSSAAGASHSHRLLREAQLSGRPLVVPPQAARSIALEFAAIDFIGSRSLQYQYRLDGFDPDWANAGAERRLASYTNLAPGEYRFRVRASRGDGQWSEEANLPITIAAYWWQTATARLLGIALIAFTVWAAMRLRVQSLARQRERLAALVTERTAALEERSRALQEEKLRAEKALQNLESAQAELLRSEKMAALGQLVAGVAHEVNTPLGVAITAASHLGDVTRGLSRRFADGSMRRSDLQGYMETAAESSSMIERNLDRAGQLIANFKQVSVDRTSDGRRNFKLAELLAELLESLQLLWKRRSIQMTVECPDHIVLDSFPGALGQVVTNLAQNAVIHAFADDSEGQMRLAVRPLDGDRVELRFSDNGRGVAAENLKRIFEPFFTTRRGQGGTGLGLHIVFNMVTQKLGGSIDAYSKLGEGTVFVLVLPLRAPGE